MGPKRGHVEISPFVDDDITEISPPNIYKKGKAGDENISEPEGKFSVSDPVDENLPGNLDPQVAPEPPPPASRRARRAPLAELALPQPQPQLPGTTKEKTPPEVLITSITVAEYHDPSIRRWISSDPYPLYESTLTQDVLTVRFNREAKPVLPRTYVEFDRRHYELCDLALVWVEKFFAPEKDRSRMTGAEVIKTGEGNPLLVRWIDSVASAHGLCWLDVLHEKRHLIAMGVLGKFLEDRVFKDEFFGAPEEEKKVLRAIDRELEMREVDDIKMKSRELVSDAFTRQKPRATYINESLNDVLALPKRFTADVDRLFNQLVELLRHLLPTTNEKQFPPEEYYETLNWIIAVAGKLSLDMRREPDTVYYVAITPPQYTGLDPERMSPVVLRAEDRKRIAAFGNRCTNVISVWPAVVAYRRLPLKKFSIRIIHRALIFTSYTEGQIHPHGTEENPERTRNEPQFWQYLKFLGVPISGDGRASYS